MWGNRGNRGNRVTLPQSPPREEVFFSSRGSKPQPSVTSVTPVTSRVLILRNAEKFKIPDSLAHYRGQLLQKKKKCSNFAA